MLVLPASAQTGKTKKSSAPVANKTKANTNTTWKAHNGNGYMAGAELNENMVSLKEGTTALLRPGSGFREGTYVFYRKGRITLCGAKTVPAARITG